jgi:hypothetical protein
MKLVLGTTLMFLLVGAPSYARQEPDKDKPQEEHKKQETPKKGEEAKKGEQPNKGRQDQEKPAEKSKQEPDRQQQPQDRTKPAQQNDRTQQQQQDDRNRNQGARPAQQQDRPQDQQRAQQTEQHNDRGTASERGGGRRVPDEQFRASFGREHHFRVHRSDDRRFNYGGYYFQYTEPWPSDWDYNNDDVYIDYIDGEYYLINPRHSGVRLLVVVVD